MRVTRRRFLSGAGAALALPYLANPAFAVPQIVFFGPAVRLDVGEEQTGAHGPAFISALPPDTNVPQGFMACWTQDDAGAVTTHARFFDDDGEPLTSIDTLGGVTGQTSGDPSEAFVPLPLSPRGLVRANLAFFGAERRAGGPLSIFAQRYSQSFVPQPSGPTRLPNRVAVETGDFVATELDNGTFLGVWSDGSALWANRFDAAGQRIGTEVRFTSPNLTYDYVPTSVGRFSGGIGVAYTATDASFVSLRIQMFNLSGVPVGVPIVLTQSQDVNRLGTGAVVRSATAGRGIALYLRRRTVDTSSNLLGRFIETDGSPGTEFLIGQADAFQTVDAPSINRQLGAPYYLMHDSETAGVRRPQFWGISQTGTAFIGPLDLDDGPDTRGGSIDRMANGVLVACWTDHSVSPSRSYFRRFFYEL